MKDVICMEAINKIIHIEMYQCDLMVHFGDKKSLLDCLLKNVEDKAAFDAVGEIQDNSIGTSILLEGGQSILYLKTIPTDSTGVSILSHEIFHVANLIMQEIGANFSSESEEAYAYLIQFLTKRIWDLLPVTFSSCAPSQSYRDDSSHTYRKASTTKS